MPSRAIKCAIIEDDYADARLLKKFIEKATHGACSTEIYTDYDAGKTALRDTGPHVAFVDLDLNGESGLDLLEGNRGNPHPFPVIAVSAMADDATQEAAIAAGAYDFLPKDDIDEKSLKRAIRHSFAAFHKERELYRIAEKERDNSDAKSSFFNRMSHDLRTPLNAIIGFADLMRLSIGGPVNQKQIEEYATIISKSGQHLLDVINTILDLAKIEQQEFKLQREWIDPGELLESQIAMLQPLLSDNDLNMTLEASHGSVLLLAEPRAFRQIFLNLLSNAVKFSNPGGEIVVSTALTNRGLEIHVTDQGIGMTGIELKRAMTPFGQAGDNASIARKGTGLGLNIVKALIEEHGGVFDLDSRKGSGTRASAIFNHNALSQTKASPSKQYRAQAVAV